MEVAMFFLNPVDSLECHTLRPMISSADSYEWPDIYILSLSLYNLL